jgi:anti-sigma28 factor (negative regulator of flagellin synthesis)
VSTKDESIFATEMRQFKEVAETYPEVRQGKVKALKRQIHADAYIIDSKSVARSIINLLI